MENTNIENDVLIFQKTTTTEMPEKLSDPFEKCGILCYRRSLENQVDENLAMGYSEDNLHFQQD